MRKTRPDGTVSLVSLATDEGSSGTRRVREEDCRSLFRCREVAGMGRNASSTFVAWDRAIDWHRFSSLSDLLDCDAEKRRPAAVGSPFYCLGKGSIDGSAWLGKPIGSVVALRGCTPTTLTSKPRLQTAQKGCSRVQVSDRHCTMLRIPSEQERRFNQAGAASHV